MKTTPRIIFVDGPTASGKDYFIENFSNVYRESAINGDAHVVVASDFVLTGDAASEARKYTAYNTPVDTAIHIYKRHVELLTYLDKLQKTLPPNDVVLVNRSFLSYWVYNWQPIEYNIAQRHYGAQTCNDFYSCYVTHYGKVVKEVLADTPTLLVVIDPAARSIGPDVLRLLTQRIKARGDGKAVNPAWLLRVMLEYATPPIELLELFTNHVRVTSGDYKEVFQTYCGTAGE